VDLRSVPPRHIAGNCSGVTEDSPIDRATLIGDTRADVTIQSSYPRDGSFGGYADQVASPDVRYRLQAPYPEVSTQPGSVLRWQPVGSMTLTSGSVSIYELDRDGTLDPLADSSGDVPIGGDTMGLDVPVPVEPGRWFVALYAAWQTDCLAGDGFLDFRLSTE
jgi:hypothetical protein